jgi:hypothetical protein
MLDPEGVKLQIEEVGGRLQGHNDHPVEGKKKENNKSSQRQVKIQGSFSEFSATDHPNPPSEDT